MAGVDVLVVVLLVLALAAYLAAAKGMSARVDLIAMGLAMTTVAVLVQKIWG